MQADRRGLTSSVATSRLTADLSANGARSPSQPDCDGAANRACTELDPPASRTDAGSGAASTASSTIEHAFAEQMLEDRNAVVQQQTQDVAPSCDAQLHAGEVVNGLDVERLLTRLEAGAVDLSAPRPEGLPPAASLWSDDERSGDSTAPCVSPGEEHVADSGVLRQAMGRQQQRGTVAPSALRGEPHNENAQCGGGRDTKGQRDYRSNRHRAQQHELKRAAVAQDSSASSSEDEAPTSIRAWREERYAMKGS